MSKIHSKTTSMLSFCPMIDLSSSGTLPDARQMEELYRHRSKNMSGADSMASARKYGKRLSGLRINPNEYRSGVEIKWVMKQTK